MHIDLELVTELGIASSCGICYDMIISTFLRRNIEAVMLLYFSHRITVYSRFKNTCAAAMF